MRNAKCTISVHRSRVSQLMGRANPVWLVSLVLYALMRPGLLDSNIYTYIAPAVGLHVGRSSCG